MIWLQVLLCVVLLATLNVCQWIVTDQTLPVFQGFEWTKKHEWISRVNAGLVEIVVFVFAAISGKESGWGYALLLGFFFQDFAHLLVYDRDILNYIHHIVVIAAFLLWRVAMTPAQVQSGYLACLVLESTSPLLQASWLMREAGYQGHPVFKGLAGTTLVLYGIMRLLVFPWLMWKHMDGGMALLLSPLLGLNVYWFSKLVGLARKALATNDGGDRRE